MCFSMVCFFLVLSDPFKKHKNGRKWCDEEKYFWVLGLRFKWSIDKNSTETLKTFRFFLIFLYVLNIAEGRTFQTYKKPTTFLVFVEIPEVQGESIATASLLFQAILDVSETR